MKDYVLATQDSGKFRTGGASSSSKAPLDEFEVDETCLRKRDASEDGQQVQWTEYVGLKRRGDPESLYLEQRDLNKSKSKRKCNGGVSPPPYTKEEWLALAKKKVRSGSLQHSDGAKAYQQNLDGVERDYVSHSTRGDGPHFVAASSVHGALAGTQSLDGWWGHAKKIASVSMQMMNRLPGTCTNNSGGTGSLKATSSKPVALSSGLLCSKNDSMKL